MNDRDRYSADAVAAGVHLLYAAAHGLAGSAAPEPDPTGDAAATEVRAILAAQGAGPEEIAAGLSAIRAARRTIEEGAAEQFSVQAYDRAREAAVAGAASSCLPGHRIWPPTSQTVRRTLGGGYWNAALAALGYPVSGLGRTPGGGRYSEDDYRTAVGEFLAAAGTAGGSASFAAYGEWVRTETAAGTRRPSGAGVRAHFGSWQAAKDAAAGVSGRAASDDRGA
ncbi:hypothetical protein [Brevibacterium ihuae]|uniref:hypothetical protein n=1 Tax=Brevibacterium ihuae TaxID=1631743 RepID=UPI000C791669|nr:hypothetical protein [Brevibacterium ihuae]